MGTRWFVRDYDPVFMLAGIGRVVTCTRDDAIQDAINNALYICGGRDHDDDDPPIPIIELSNDGQRFTVTIDCPAYYNPYLTIGIAL